MQLKTILNQVQKLKTLQAKISELIIEKAFSAGLRKMSVELESTHFH